MSSNRLTGGVLAGTLLAGLAFSAGCAPTDTTGGNTSIWPIVILVVLMLASMYFLTIRPQQKRVKQQQELLAGIKRGDQVITIGGIYGQVESVEENSVVLRVESGATIRVAKSAVSGKSV